MSRTKELESQLSVNFSSAESQVEPQKQLESDNVKGNAKGGKGVKPKEDKPSDPDIKESSQSLLAKEIIAKLNDDKSERKTSYVQIAVKDEDGNISKKIVHLKLSKLEIKELKKAGIILRNCGHVKDLARNCPDLFPKNQRCAKCADGTLIRYGIGPDGEPADPDAEGCVPHPCVVWAGEDPDEVALEAFSEDDNSDDDIEVVEKEVVEKVVK